MLRRLLSFYDFKIHAQDGQIGTIEGTYFDDREWTVRYLLVDTGSWLSRRTVLVSPISLGGISWQGKTMRVNLRRGEIEQSPYIDPEAELSVDQEAKFYEYHDWPNYWSRTELWGVATFPRLAALAPPALADPKAMPGAPPEHHHLHRPKKVIGFEIQVGGTESGRVEDFFFDDGSWVLRYLVVQTGARRDRRRSLLAVEWIAEARWDDRVFVLDVDSEALAAAPAWDEAREVTPDAERALHAHYGKVLAPAYEGLVSYAAARAAFQRRYLEEIRGLLRDWETTVERLKAKTAKLSGDLREVADTEVGWVDGLLEEARCKVEALAAADDAAWDAAAEAVDRRIETLKDHFGVIWARLR